MTYTIVFKPTGEEVYWINEVSFDKLQIPRQYMTDNFEIVLTSA